MKYLNKSQIILLLITIGYVVLTILTANNCYIGDNIQQISKEAHWFYQTNFSSLLMPAQDSGSQIVATGYHPPLMGFMTAILWKVFGYQLWVSHVFALIWALILIFNVWKLINLFIPEKFAVWAFLVVMLEPTILTQFSIASPDFILFTAFIVSLRAVFEKKSWLLVVGLFFLCGINMRGIFVGAILFISHCYFVYLQDKKLGIRSLLNIILPYLPILILLAVYFIYYFTQRGWFFTNTNGSDHYTMPAGVSRIIRHLAEFGLRTVENGRILIWLLGFYVTFKVLKSKSSLSIQTKTLLLFWALLTALYLLFVGITQMPFSARYFMPQYFLLTMLVMIGLTTIVEFKRNTLVFILILIFELTGNCWIYPEMIAKSWDCTMAHLPYYEVRKECFNYIDQQKLDYNEISAGFSLYGDRKFAELKNSGKAIDNEPNKKYFIYSNISNVEDSLVYALKNKTQWEPVKRFEKGVIFIQIYRNLSVKRIEP